MNIRVDYGDIAVGAKEDMNYTVTNNSDYCVPNIFKKSGKALNYAFLGEPYAVALDGSLNIIPSDYSNVFPLISSELSGEDGTFTNPVVLTATTDKQYSSIGITIVFDTYTNNHSRNIHVAWYKDGAVLFESDYQPDSARYFVDKEVEFFDKLVITFYDINMPQNRLHVNDIIIGKITTFDKTIITKLSLLHEIDPIAESISINTVDVDLSTTYKEDLSLQKKQPMYTYFDDELVQTTFVTKWNERPYQISTESYISLLEDTNFNGGMYTNKSVVELVDEILTPAGVPYSIDSALSSKTLTGYLPICTRREALRQVAFAIMATVNTAYNESVQIISLSDTVQGILDETNTFSGQSVNYQDKITKVELTAYAYVPSQTTTTLYNAAESGTGNNINVTFSEPIHSLTISNGNILQSGANYAIINTSNTKCVLSGKKYDVTQTVITKENPNTLPSDIENIKSLSNNTLISRDIADAVAEHCINYLSQRYSINEKVIMGDLRIGDTVQQKFKDRESITGRITSVKYQITGSAKYADIEVT